MTDSQLVHGAASANVESYQHICRLTILEIQLLIDDVCDQSTHLRVFRPFESH